MTLLIVDDDTLVAQSLQAILEASGEVTVLAVGTSGKEALSLYERSCSAAGGEVLIIKAVAEQHRTGSRGNNLNPAFGGTAFVSHHFFG